MVRTPEERKEENEKLMKFVSEQCETADKPLNLENVVAEFISKEGSNTAHGTLVNAVGNYKNKEVFEIECRRTRVRQMFALKVPIHKTLLTELKVHAKVSLGRRTRIKSYEAYDGSLTLSAVEKRSLDPELQPPALKRPRVEDSEDSSGIWRPSTSSSFENLPCPGLDNVKREVQVQVMENLEVNNENAEATTPLAPSRDLVKTEEPDSSVAPNLVTPVARVLETRNLPATSGPSSSTQTQSGSTAPAQSLPSALLATPAFSSATQMLTPTGFDVNTVTAPGGTSAPTARNQQNPSVAYEIITLDDEDNEEEDIKPVIPSKYVFPSTSSTRDDEEEDVKPEITSSNDPSQPSVPPSTSSYRDLENSHHQEHQPQTNEIRPMLTISTQVEILKSLEAIIGIMDLPLDSSEVKDQIQKINSKDGNPKTIKMEDVRKTIDYAIVVAKLDRRSEGETRSLKEFLKLVQFTVVKDQFEQIQKELKEELETLKTKDMQVSVSNIITALGAILNILVSN